ncbi:MAG: hypothetical protein IJ835_02540 [Muribaculaceae bacterium]|nr:hypothetical protein [Muribaculaceae bacterium]
MKKIMFTLSLLLIASAALGADKTVTFVRQMKPSMREFLPDETLEKRLPLLEFKRADAGSLEASLVALMDSVDANDYANNVFSLALEPKDDGSIMIFISSIDPFSDSTEYAAAMQRGYKTFLLAPSATLQSLPTKKRGKVKIECVFEMTDYPLPPYTTVIGATFAGGVLTVRTAHYCLTPLP